MPTDGPPLPDPKARTLARGPRRYRRKVASPKQWQAIIAAKETPCRCCFVVMDKAGTTGNGKVQEAVEFHHVVSRQDGGDDVADNIVPLCHYCHDAITRRVPECCNALITRLTDAEYAYAIQRGGEGYFERAYGVRYER